MNLAKALRGIVRYAKENPEVVLAGLGMVAPKLVRGVLRKAGPIVAAVLLKDRPAG